MPHDVFISYSTKNKSAADAACAMLESRKFRCWIAPRDILPGQPYAASLIEAIGESKVVVLILSEDANRSKHVLRELEEAVDHGIPIVPLRIEKVEPSGEMRYYIKSIHWLDALNAPLEQHLLKLVNTVQALLGVNSEEGSVLSSTEMSQQTAAPLPASGKRRIPVWVIVAGTILLAAAAGIIGIQSLAGAKPSGSAQQMEDPDSEVHQGAGESQNLGWSDWEPVSFTTAVPDLWDISMGGTFESVDQQSTDAFAWSTSRFEGDLILSLDVQGKENTQTDICVIIYGNGVEFIRGNLIFCVQSDVYVIKKHTHYEDETNIIATTPSGINLSEGVTTLVIEIVGDTASMYVNGDRVLTTVFDQEEIIRSGRIGLLKPWYSPGMIFSNISIQTPE